MSSKNFSLLVLPIVLISCNSCKNPPKKLNLFNWKYYIGDSTVEKFEKEYNVVVNISYYSSNEECLASLKSSKGNYDIVIPSDYMVGLMIKENLLSEIDRSKIDNFKNIDTFFIGSKKGFDPDDKFSVPYMFGTTGFARNRTKIRTSIKSWDDFLAVGDSEKYTLLDDVRFVYGSLLMNYGYDPNTLNEAELKRVTDTLLKHKKNLKVFTHDTPKEMLINGEANLSYAWSGDVLQSSFENPDVVYELPEKGTLMFQDGICIPKEAPHPDVALLFINFLLRPEISAGITNTIKYGNTNREARALIDKNIRDNPVVFPSGDYLLNCKRIKDLGEKISIYEKYWNLLKEN